MSDYAAFFARWRVRLGYPLAIAVLVLARPTPQSIVIGALVGAIGLSLRAYAAGYLHKKEQLTVAGPYAFTRNPLYVGSSILALGAGLATRSAFSAAILLAYFAIVYSIVMRREEGELRHFHGAAFDAYAQAVPLFFPRLTPAHLAAATKPAEPGSFSAAQYKKNHEWQAAVGFLLLLAFLLILWRLRPH
jgi:protein-S-isoprenylcysteine O-methyltransferase Ste14